MKDESQTSIKSSTSVISNSKKNEKNIKLANYNEREEAKIGELDNKSENELKLEGENKTLTQNSSIDNLKTKNNDITKNSQHDKSNNINSKKGT